jgi:hypothetical protein
MRRFLFLIVAAMLCGTSAKAAVIEASFSKLLGSSWQGEFRLTNDGSPAEITGFTVYFAETLFANLVLVASPSEWDSLVIEPDTALPAAGFLDALLLDPSQPLLTGQSTQEFSLAFEFLGTGAPPMLPFQIVDEDFQTLFEGRTVPFVSQVPEPGSLALAAVGLGLIGAAVRRRARGVGSAVQAD